MFMDRKTHQPPKPHCSPAQTPGSSSGVRERQEGQTCPALQDMLSLRAGFMRKALCYSCLSDFSTMNICYF